MQRDPETSMRHPTRWLPAILALSPQAAFAHSGPDHVAGFASGFAHPLGGLDHALAMLAVGLLAAHLAGRALWALPLAFLGAMAFGGAIGAAGIAFPFVELGIAVSVVALGLALALGRLPLQGALAAAAIFGVFHGHAHGAELPVTGSAAAYGLGFLAATALLHIAGITAGLASARGAGSLGRLGRQGAGAAIALAGLVIISAAF
jgi:urease accessory protein